jgi:hypothetical protein
LFCITLLTIKQLLVFFIYLYFTCCFWTKNSTWILHYCHAKLWISHNTFMKDLPVIENSIITNTVYLYQCTCKWIFISSCQNDNKKNTQKISNVNYNQFSDSMQ